MVMEVGNDGLRVRNSGVIPVRCQIGFELNEQLFVKKFINAALMTHFHPHA